MDRPEEYLKPDRTEGDRLLQVQVGIGIERRFTPANDEECLRLIVNQLWRVVHQVPLSQETREAVLAQVESCRDER
jgi:hypothetical protein